MIRSPLLLFAILAKPKKHRLQYVAHMLRGEMRGYVRGPNGAIFDATYDADRKLGFRTGSIRNEIERQRTLSIERSNSRFLTGFADDIWTTRGVSRASIQKETYKRVTTYYYAIPRNNRIVPDFGKKDRRRECQR